MNQTNNQSIDQFKNQTKFNPTIERTEKQTIGQSNKQAVRQTTKQSIKQSNNQTIKQSNDQTIKQSNNQTIKQSKNSPASPGRVDPAHSLSDPPCADSRSCIPLCGDNNFGNDPTRRTNESCLGNRLPFLSLAPLLSLQLPLLPFFVPEPFSLFSSPFETFSCQGPFLQSFTQQTSSPPLSSQPSPYHVHFHPTTPGLPSPRSCQHPWLWAERRTSLFSFPRS